MAEGRATSSSCGKTAATSANHPCTSASASVCDTGASLLPMHASLEFLLGLLERDDLAHVAHEDFTGRHGPALRLWQQMGFVACEAGVNPVPSCPHCGEGVPYILHGRYLCNRCASTV